MADRKARTDRKGRKKGRKDEGEDNEPQPEPTLPDGPKTYCVGGEWSSLESINECIKLCEAQDKIVVKPGRYNEKVVLRKDKLDISGVSGTREEIVICGGLINDSQDSRLASLTIKSGVEVESGSINITNCLIQDAKYTLAVHAYAKPTVKNCLLEQARASCIYMFPNAGGHLESNVLKGDAKGNGVGIFCDNANATFKKNHIDNFVNGIYVQGECQGLLFDRNEIQNITGTGIHITNKAAPHCKANLIHCCQYYGMLIDKESAPVIDKNTIQASKVMITKGCKATLKNNTITGKVVDENEVHDAHLDPAY